MIPNSSVVAVYKTHFEAEEAVKELHRSGVNMRQCSIVGQGHQAEEEVVGFYNAGDRMEFWGKQGAFWGGIWGLVFGSGFFLVPGLGPVVAGGAVVSAMVGALQGAVVVGGLNVLGAGLYSIGIPKDSILRFEVALKAHKYIIIFHGTAEETIQARAILEATAKEMLEIMESQVAAAQV